MLLLTLAGQTSAEEKQACGFQGWCAGEQAAGEQGAHGANGGGGGGEGGGFKLQNEARQALLPPPISPYFPVLARACLCRLDAPVWVLTSPRA